MAEFIKSKATQIENLIAGRGIPDEFHKGMTAVTGINRTPDRNPEADKNTKYVRPKARFQRHLWFCSELSPIDTFTYDMLRRAASISDGNAFYGAYTPDARKAPNDDLSLQYDKEAAGAAMALDGLNIVPEDIVLAAAMGKSFTRLDPAEHAPSECESIAALERIVLRVVCDTGDEKVAAIRLSGFMNRLKVTQESLFGPEDE